MDAILEKLNQTFVEVGKRDGIADFRLSPNGTAGLQLKSGTRIFFEYVSEKSLLFIYSPLLKLPTDDARAAALFRTALALNFLNANGTLAVSEYFQELAYQRAIAVAGLDADRLDQIINEVIEQRAALLAHLEKKPGQTPGTKGADRNDRRAFARLLEKYE
jgi:hypothetical protein